MNEESKVINSIENELREFDPKYIGEIRQNIDYLTVIDGKLTVKVKLINDSENPNLVHVHVLSNIDTIPNEELDACIVGYGKNREEALVNAGRRWVGLVGFPVLSLCHAIELGSAVHFSGNEIWGVQGCHGFVGPLSYLNFNMSEEEMDIVYQTPVFENVAELTPGGLLHIAKVVISDNGNGGWNRKLEIDGHKAEYYNESWDPGIPFPGIDYATISQFVIYHYFGQPDIAIEKQALDEAIWAYMKYIKDNLESDLSSIQQILVQQGHREDHIYWLDHFLPLAFIRVRMKDSAAVFSNDYYLGLKGGTISQTKKLIENPIFARSFAMGLRLNRSNEYLETFNKIAFFAPEVSSISKYIDINDSLEGMITQPAFIPDQGLVNEELKKAIDEYLTYIHSK